MGIMAERRTKCRSLQTGAGIIEEANDQGLTVDYMRSLAEVAITTSTADKNSSASEPSIASGNSAQTA